MDAEPGVDAESPRPPELEDQPLHDEALMDASSKSKQGGKIRTLGPVTSIRLKI